MPEIQRYQNHIDVTLKERDDISMRTNRSVLLHKEWVRKDTKAQDRPNICRKQVSLHKGKFGQRTGRLSSQDMPELSTCC